MCMYIGFRVNPKPFCMFAALRVIRALRSIPHVYIHIERSTQIDSDSDLDC